MNDLNRCLTAADFENPSILLSGSVDYAMYQDFRAKLDKSPKEGIVIVELSTLGGDPEVARMMGEDVRYHSDLYAERRFVFLGKAAIYSAGTTFMSFFVRENRYLTRGTRLMVHERQLTKTVELNGPLTRCIANVRAVLNEIESSIEIQEEGFRNLIAGSSVDFDEVRRRASENWYIEANDAVSLGLVSAVI